MMTDRDIDGYMKLCAEHGVEGFTREKIKELSAKGDICTAKMHSVYQFFCKVFGYEAKGLEEFLHDAQMDLFNWVVGDPISPWTRLLIDEQLKEQEATDEA